ncbi:SGNH/GDSL hydrolase family protein [Lentzea aerocolonigenes]|uniref:SGNH/GDSL hydrolase family protein n=1 Tax=Lentzea aerocolonigenes TaxID=68170 RepID=UPI0004C3C0A6|nr:SGNH/GDSL hydrolase family protein [Lentzea aerocolonigenes]MCP2249032.1 Lysophospholipase L1 [Lentzea aerocolonigenes]
MRVLAVLALLLGLTTPATASPGWVAAWGSAMQTPVSSDVSGTSYTVRNVVRLTAGGSTVRVRLSNVFSSGDLTVGKVSVAPAGTGAALGTQARRVTFRGRESVVVPRGGEVLSDPVALRTVADSSVAVSIWASSAPAVATYHRSALSTNYVAQGDHARDLDGAAFTQKVSSWYYLSEVAVTSPVRGSVVALGDSITDGSGSTGGAHRRWTDVLASRTALGVVNSGISGNQFLRDDTYGVSGISRTPRDVLARSGVRTLIVLEGINDIKAKPDATFEELRDGYLRVISLAHSHGVRVLGGTITPMGGYANYTDAREAVRSAVNSWIRSSGAFDGVVDFDAAVRDPARPTWLREEFARPDRLHLTDAGYSAMGQAVDVSLL